MAHYRVLLFLSLLVIAEREAQAQRRPVKRPTTTPRDCTEGDCHAKVTEYAILHGPLGVGSCGACHRLTNPETHRFQLTRKREVLCRFCHQIEAGAFTHAPLEKGACLDCHNPHGGKTRGLLISDSTQELCDKCHERVVKAGQFQHTPVKAGGCMACHGAHVSDHPKLLLKERRQLCVDCHVTFESRMSRSRVVHEPVKKDCLLCHDAHASSQKELLTRAPGELCLSCHDDQRATVEEAKTPHGAVIDDRACLNCHDSHGTTFPRLLRNNVRDLCLGCHNKPIETPSGTIADMSKILATGRSLHGPIARDNCSACHQIHGGDLFRLLVREYPSEFYAPFREESYALCLSCHERALVLTPRTTSLTGFRNGDLNLHFLHVNRETKGRTCRACHETHASDRSKHVRDYVPFGQWKMPVGFTKTESGGYCAPGCHDRFAYDRANPITYEERTKDRPVTWPSTKKGGDK